VKLDETVRRQTRAPAEKP